MNDAIGGSPTSFQTTVAPYRRNPLIPRETISGRSLVIVIAIMTYLACLVAGTALLVARGSTSWRSDVLKDVTIQIRPRAGDNVENLVAATVSLATRQPEITGVHVYSEDESRQLLKPWLGAEVDLSLLPVPQIIVAHLRDPDTDRFQQLSAAFSVIPQASLDDHRLWAGRLNAVANTIMTFAGFLFVLIVLALSTAVGFATRGAVAGNREIVEVLHFVGADDGFIAREFGNHFRRLGFEGALIGAPCAIASFLAVSIVSAWSSAIGPGKDIQVLLGSVSLDGFGLAAVLAVGVIIAVLTGYISRRAVLNHLNQLH